MAASTSGKVRLLSGLLGCGVRCGQTFVIAKTVPNTEIKSGKDWYNALGPAVAQGVKWVFATMAQPWRVIPLCSEGQPFADVARTGDGLSQHERRELLAVVQTSEYQIDWALFVVANRRPPQSLSPGGYYVRVWNRD